MDYNTIKIKRDDLLIELISLKLGIKQLNFTEKNSLKVYFTRRNKEKGTMENIVSDKHPLTSLSLDFDHEILKSTDIDIENDVLEMYLSILTPTKVKKNKPIELPLKKMVEQNTATPIQLASNNTEIIMKCSIMRNEIEQKCSIEIPEMIEVEEIQSNEPSPKKKVVEVPKKEKKTIDVHGLRQINEMSKPNIKLIEKPNEKTSNKLLNLYQTNIATIKNDIFDNIGSSANDSPVLEYNNDTLALRIQKNLNPKSSKAIKTFMKIKETPSEKSPNTPILLNNNQIKCQFFNGNSDREIQSPMRSSLPTNSIKHSFTNNPKMPLNNSPMLGNRKKQFFINPTVDSEIILKTIPDQFNHSYEILESNQELNEANDFDQLDDIELGVGLGLARRLGNEEPSSDSFCCAVFISGLNQAAEFIPNSNTYPSICGHPECAILPSLQSSILSKYQCERKQTVDIPNIASEFCFPIGLKLCYKNEEKPSPLSYNSYMNIMKNEKSEIFYIMSLFYYKRATASKYEKEYLQSPLKEFAKFQEVLENESNYDEKEFFCKLEIMTQFIEKEEVLIPESISLVSKYPYFNQMEMCLKKLITLSGNDKAQMINHIINEICVPEKSRKVMFYIPNELKIIELNSPFTQNRLPLSPGNLHLLFDYFSTENIVTIFHFMLLEQKILFIHNDYNILSNISFAFISLLYPLAWANTYIPVVSLSTVKFFQSIIPFVMGTDEFLLKYSHDNHFMEDDSPSIIYVSLTKDLLSLSINLKKRSRSSILKELKLPDFPSKVNDYLISQLRDLKKGYKANKFTVEKVNEKIKEIVCHGMVMLLGDYKKHMFMTHEDMPLFNSEGFLSMKEKKEKHYYSEALITQMFSQFLLNEKMQLSRKNKRKLSNISLNESNIKSNRSISIEKDNEIIDTTYFAKMLFKYNEQSISKNPHRSFSLKKVQSKRNMSNDSKLNISNSNISNINLETNASKYEPSHTLTRKDSMTSLDINNNNKNINVNYLIPPYFINDSNIKTDKGKIEEFIQATTKTKDKPKGQSNIIYNYNNENFRFDNVKDSLKRYSTQLLDKKPLIEQYFTSQINKTTIPDSMKNNINPIQVNIDETLLSEKEIEEFAEWFTNICAPEKNNHRIKLMNITEKIKTKQHREYFSNLIMQSSILDDRNNKMLSASSFDEMLRAIKYALSIVTKTEIHTCKLLTLALFSYYKSNKKNIFIYEEFTKKYKNNICQLWSLDSFWVKWYKEDLIEKENQNDDDSLSSNDNNEEDYPKYLLLRMEELMKHLCLDGELIKNVILKDLGSQYLDPEDFIDFEQKY